MNQFGYPKAIKYGVIGLASLIGLAIFWPFATVPTGHRAVVTHFGKVTGEVLDEGLHLVTPIMTTLRIVSVQLQASDVQAGASSKDMQQITTHVVVNWSMDPTKVAKIIHDTGDQEALLARAISPAVNEVFKAATAKRTAEEIISKRIELTQDVDMMLKERLAKYDVIVRDISLVDVDFTAEFNRAVEAKQVAEQQAKQAEYTAQKATADAKATVNKARGEAEAILANAEARAKAQKLLQSTITPQLLQQQAIEKWDGSMPQVMGSQGSGMLFNIPTGARKAGQSE